MVIGLKKEKKMKIKMPQFRVEIKMPAVSGRKNAASWGLCRQFSVDKYASHFGSENMLAISGRKICRRFQVGKNAGNVGSEQNGKFEPEKNACKFGPKIKMPVFLGGDKAGELTGLL